MPLKEELFIELSAILESIRPESYIYTPPSFFTKKELSRLCAGSCLTPKEIKAHRNAHDQECHAISSLAWLKDPSLTMYTGIAYMDDFGDWVQHTFAVDTKNNVIEPTPMLRDTYYGHPMSLLETLKFVRDELQNIGNLGFKPNKLWSARITELCKNKQKQPAALKNFLKFASDELDANYGKIIKSVTRQQHPPGTVITYY